MVSAYRIDANTGGLTSIGTFPTGNGGVAGNGPAAVAVDGTGSCVFVANFLSNNVSAYKVTPITGALTHVNGSPFPAGTGPLGVSVDPFTTDLVYVANALDNPGSVSAYTTTSSTCILTPVPGSPFSDPALVSAPASVVVDQTGSFVYVANEFSNSVSAFSINLNPGPRNNPPFGKLTAIGPPAAAGTCPISVVAGSSGQNFIYVSNDGSNDVSAYTYNAGTGALTALPRVPAGNFPGLAAVSPGGGQFYVPNFGDNTVSAYSINGITGALTEILPRVVAGNGPTSVALIHLVNVGDFAYVTNALANPSSTVSGYSKNGTTGALTVLGPPFPVPAGSFAIFGSLTP